MADTAGETRRSSRIAAQPKKDDHKEVKPARKPSKKRTAEAEGSKEAKEAPAAKKVRY